MAKTKKKQKSGQQRGKSGESTLSDYVQAFLAGGKKRRFSEIEEYVREERQKAGFDISPSFNGQVWHATNRVADPVEGERGMWKLSKEKLKGRKESGRPKKEAKKVSKKAEPEPEPPVDLEEEDEEEEDEDGDEEDDDEGDEA